jgi:integrase
MPALICLGAEHGASRQEALSLRWQNINFEFGEYGMIRLFRTSKKVKG